MSTPEFRKAGLVLVVCSMALMLAPDLARAQDSRAPLPALQLQRFRPAPGPGDYLTHFGTPVAPHLDWQIGAYLDYADDPLLVPSVDSPYTRTVDSQLHLGLHANIGLLDVLEVGLWAPMTLMQSSEELQPLLPAGSASSRDLSRFAAGDWRLSAKYRLLDLAEFPVGLAFVTALSLPIGNSDAFGSDGGVGAEAIAAADYILFGKVRTGANLGFRYRPGQRILRDSTVGNELLWGLSAHVPFITENLDTLFEIGGAIGVANKKVGARSMREGEVPVEVKGAFRYRMHRSWALTTGVGAGLTEGIGAPNFRIFVGLGGQWVTGGWFNVDYASPGFRGQLAPCPFGDRYAENVELDEYGCPIPVIVRPELPDEDTVARLIEVEAPPRRPAPPPPEPPEPERVKLTHTNIIITEQVHFATAKDEILPQSYPILNDIVRVLERNPQIALLRVEGHTDSVGRDQANLELSQRRAESVRRYLIEHGIAAERLEAMGYGRMRPIADNATREGRALNRRVEFVILESR